MTEYVINRLGQHADGVADGPVFVPMALPGEVVTGVLSGTQLGEVKIITPSDQRVAAPCRHFKSCGGCQLQHASDDLVAQWKVDLVRHAIGAHGLETHFREIKTSPIQSRRRATFAARRTKKGALVGFFGRASDAIIEIPDCILIEPKIKQGMAIAHALALIGASRKIALAVTVTASAEGLDVSVNNGKPLDGPLQQELAVTCDRLGLARLAWDGDVVAMRAPPFQRFGRALVTPPPGSFLQATVAGETALLGAVQDIVAKSEQVVDLFAGCGTFALPLAENAEVQAFEGDAAMVEALDQGWRRATGLKKVVAVKRDLFRRPLMPDELRKIDAAVIDPPRAGAEAQVAELAQSAVPKIAYVSCNPVTFARDANVLVKSGYALDWIQVVDQFRWSPHIEIAACFSKT